MEQLRSNDRIELAREFILSTRANIFLTGKAGTGKTTLLRNVVGSLGKRAVIAAPTGVAALNAGGVTLHSLFQLPFGPYLPNHKMGGVIHQRIRKSKLSLIRSIELLIIDEISMVRSDVLDAIDNTLRTLRRSMLPFGGVQLLMIGDVQQLAPICRDDEWELLRETYSTPYFFGSKALERSQYVTVELDEIFRQSDSYFTNILNAVRENRVTNEILEQLNQRYIPEFDPSEDDDYILLTTHNNTANAINQSKLAALKTQTYNYDAKVSGSFSESAYPNDSQLELKMGAQVLFIKNDISPEKRYYNGLLGRVVAIDQQSVTVQPKTGGAPIRVESVSWDSIEYNINKESGEMEQKINGSFSQIPLKCAWAITIHKSQGLSFDRAVIDASGSFAHGQVYVALSRCRSLEGMVLRRPISMSAIVGEVQIESFCQHVSRNQPTKEILEAYKREYYSAVLCEIYNFESMQRLLWDMMSEMTGALSRSYPKLTSALIDYLATFDKAVVVVGESFQKQIKNAVYQNERYLQDTYIKERLRSAAEYFEPKLEPLTDIAEMFTKVEPGSADSRKRMAEYSARLNSTLKISLESLSLCRDGFSIEKYQAERAKMLALQALSEGEKERSRTATKRGSKESTERLAEVNDILHEELLETLKAWRLEEAREIGKPAFVILPNRTLMQIQGVLPSTVKELSKVVGMGKVKLEKYGDQIVDIVNDYCFSNNIDRGGKK